MERAAAGDVARRANTTVDDLAGRIPLVRDAAQAAGRPRDAVQVATQIWYVAFGSPAHVRAAEEELCSSWAGISYRPLDRSPYLLFGSPVQMAEALQERREAYGLERISLSEQGGIAAAPPDPLRFCREVVPLLG
jgi:alkanesulfonate monooxygenase SsuD/methylene tetrahydromethanopterin reductase-like flavin-dependent oxidoreductase (luciferase family)